MSIAATGARAPAEAAGGPSAAGLRGEIDRLIAAGEPAAAAAALAALWTREPSQSAAGFVVSRFEQLRPHLNLRPYRIAILRSFTVEPLVPLLRAGSFAGGIDLTVHTSDFNAYVQELVDAGSPLYAFQPDAVILAVQTRDVAPELWRDFMDLEAARVTECVERIAREVRGWVAGFRARSEAHVIVHNFEQPPAPAAGLLDAQAADGQSDAIRRINRELQAIAASHRGVYVLDYDGLIARHGRAAWHDERKWLTVRLPMAAAHLNHLAREWLRFVHPLAGKSAKALVVDLDNTLWGGVIGEDGIDGIKLGPDYPGAAFLEVQRALLDIRQRGILLAICSKNNPDDALEAMRRHPGMLVTPSDFAAVRINWDDKASNLRDIARELNVGVDALAFVDDNPVERQQIRAEVPEAQVIELPADPMLFAAALRESPLFERLTLSAEDRQRTVMYDAQRARDQLLQDVASRDDFYRSLEQEAEIAPLNAQTLARIAQLTNKTNQFNLTTRRYTEAELQKLAASPDWHCFSIRVRDRFGDNGLVGVAIVHGRGDVHEIDTLLLSCRVIGRTVETAFLSFLGEHARRAGARWLEGAFVPTRKNAPAKDFYQAHGFTCVWQSDEGARWRIDLNSAPLPSPEWIRLRTPMEHHA